MSIIELLERKGEGNVMAKRPFPLCVTESTVTLPDGTVKDLQNLSNIEKQLLSRHIVSSTFEAVGLKVTFQETIKVSTG